MKKNRDRVQQIGKTRIFPISVKILSVFTCLILLSCFSTNIISALLSQRQISGLSSTILADQLKQVFMTSTNQFQVFKYSGDKNASVNTIKTVASTGLGYTNSIACAFDTKGKMLYLVSGKISGTEQYSVSWEDFPDIVALASMNTNLVIGKSDGIIRFNSDKGQYSGVYKFQKDWNLYFLRADLVSDIHRTTYINFGITSGIIILITFAFIWVGFILLRKILENIGTFAKAIWDMQQKQEMGQIDLSKAPNDDVTYFAASFNSLSSSVNNLLSTFKKYVPQDIVQKAYSKQEISLEGKQRELTIMFSDIKSFTYRTEILGNEIIDLLNVHYDRIIHLIHENDGIVGSIIGDAVLGIYGLENRREKSLQALDTAWQITKVTEELRDSLKKKRAEIEAKRTLTLSEERVYKACLIDVGVGLDGGKVFYGNIGSKEHMANTVIGDDVNSSSRLEGLTRIYFLPIIVSDYIRQEVQKISDKYLFVEIDTVQVKGKTEGSKVYFPLNASEAEPEVIEDFEIFHNALENYYSGDWVNARKNFKDFKKKMNKLGLPYEETADVFIHRIGLKSAPENWSGIWTMTSK